MNANEKELHRSEAAAEGCDEVLALSVRITELFAIHTDALEAASEEQVCRDFANVLLDHWHLCAITTFLVDAAGSLVPRAIHIDEHVDAKASQHAAARLAEHIRRADIECDIWVDPEDGRRAAEDRDADACRTSPDGEVELAAIKSLVAESHAKAAFGVPIHRRGRLIGVLVAQTNLPADLLPARRGMRFIATPIVTGIANARRADKVRAQRGDIHRLHEELSRRNAELEEANLELQRIARYRSLFLARMSHELRTPLTSMLGFTEILLDVEDLTPTQRRYCEKIQASGLQQQESLNALVDLSRLEAGHAEMFLHEFSPREMLRESCAAVARLARKAEVTLDKSVSDDFGSVVADEGKLRQVLYNFLAFAIHRTPPGGRVIARMDDIKDDAERSARRFLVEITDEGEPLGDPSHLFDPIDAGHAPGAMPNARGTDMNELGLVIAHRLIGVMGGTIELHEHEPRGLRVRLTFPRLPPAESGSPLVLE